MNKDRICLASIHTEDMAPLAQITWNQNKKIYCETKGYDSRLKIQKEPYQGFDKILFLESIINEKKHDLILWCDCDTLITNFNKNIEDIISPENEKYHFFLTTDVNGINGGVFLFRTSEEGLKYFFHIREKMYEYSHENKYRFGEEQTAMIKTYLDPQFTDIIKILPQKIMNSYDYDLYGYERHRSLDKLGTQGHWDQEDFIIHIPGFGPDLFEQRMGHFKYYINKVKNNE